jgi:hypothetical protein
MTKKELLHLHKLLDAMMSKADVWVPHWSIGWQPTKIVNINRAGSVTVVRSKGKGFHACPAKEVRLEEPKEGKS